MNNNENKTMIPAAKKKAPKVQNTKRRSAFQLLISVIFSIFCALLALEYGEALVRNIAGSVFAKSFPDPVNDVKTAPLVPALVAGGLIMGWFFATFLMRTVERLGQKWEKSEDSEKITSVVGIALGFIVATFFIGFLNALPILKPVVIGLVVGIGVLFTAISIYAMHTMKESLPWYRGKIRAKRTGIKILDTNVIIDGRVYDVAKTGFVEGVIYVPQFVLEELQYIADSHDALRRQRGKRGLDILKIMQGEFNIEVGIHDRLAPEQGDGVDSRLVRLATALGGDLVTNDHNLNRVATLQDVRVLNINDLALSLRPNVLPQEHLNLTIVREGNQAGQGVGYLDDGTMVIVENGRNHLNETHNVLVTQVIQTERGKLIFGEIEGEPVESPRRKVNPPTTRRP
jgi:uncharacterized protein YacL